MTTTAIIAAEIAAILMSTGAGLTYTTEEYNAAEAAALKAHGLDTAEYNALILAEMIG